MAGSSAFDEVGFFGGWLVCFSDVFQITIAENELFILSTKCTCLTYSLSLTQDSGIHERGLQHEVVSPVLVSRRVR